MALFVINPQHRAAFFSCLMCKRGPLGDLYETEEFSPNPEKMVWFVLTADVCGRSLQIAVPSDFSHYLRASFHLNGYRFTTDDVEMLLTTADLGEIQKMVGTYIRTLLGEE